MDHQAIVFILLLRVLVPLSILRWPLGGFLASIVADGLDRLLSHAFGVPLRVGPLNYTDTDKLLDTYYMGLGLFVAMGWHDDMARGTAALLFTWRMLGVIIIELNGPRHLLLWFPALFEFWYLFWTVRNKWFPTWRLTQERLLLVLVLLLAPKLLQEFLLHWEGGRLWNPMQRHLDRILIGRRA